MENAAAQPGRRLKKHIYRVKSINSLKKKARKGGKTTERGNARQSTLKPKKIDLSLIRSLTVKRSLTRQLKVDKKTKKNMDKVAAMDLELCLNYFEISRAYFLSNRKSVVKKLNEYYAESRSLVANITFLSNNHDSSKILASTKQLLSVVTYLRSYPILKKTFFLYLHTLKDLKEMNLCLESSEQFKAIARWNTDFETEMKIYDIRGYCN